MRALRSRHGSLRDRSLCDHPRAGGLFAYFVSAKEHRAAAADPDGSLAGFEVDVDRTDRGRACNALAATGLVLVKMLYLHEEIQH